jgi:drug/metabolite transporter (DMT)-like permease
VLTAICLSASGGAVAARQWLGLCLGFAGLLLVVSTKFGPGGEANWLNTSLAVGALLSITAGTLYQKKFIQPCDVRSANLVQLAAALVVTLPLALLEPAAIAWEPELLWAMAWSVLALTLGGSSLLYLLIERGAATSVASLMYLVPPSTALLAWLLFNETITVITLAGTGLSVLGVALVVRQAKTHTAASQTNKETQ